MLTFWVCLADEEAELHWQPITGLPEPLTAKACSSSRAAPAHSQLEKQVCCTCSFALRIGYSSTPHADQFQLTDECIRSILSYSAHSSLKFAFSCSQCSQTTEVPMVWTVMSWSRDNLVYVPTDCLYAA